MIPKRLIFIWLENEIPDYGKFCINAFRKMNPDFEMMFVHEQNMKNIQNQDLKDCISLIYNENYNFYRHMVVRPWAKKHLTSEIGRITAISDAFRFYLLNKYGGIYLDLDTFPVKPFDDQLLNYSGFAVNHIKDRCDYFFLGFNSGCVDENDLLFYKKEYAEGQIFNYAKVHKIRYPDKLINKFNNVKNHIMEKFIKGTLQFGESIMNKKWPEYYVDHFRIKCWQKTHRK